MKMLKDSSVKYHQKTKKRFEKGKQSMNMVANDIETFLRIII